MSSAATHGAGAGVNTARVARLLLRGAALSMRHPFGRLRSLPALGACVTAICFAIPGCFREQDECVEGTLGFCENNALVTCEHAYSDDSAPMKVFRRACGDQTCRVPIADRPGALVGIADCFPGECLADADCPTSSPHCTLEMTCVQCRDDNADCPAELPSCVKQQCVECRLGTQCATGYCDPTQYRCALECVTDSECAAERPRCADNHCRCLQDSDCVPPFRCDCGRWGRCVTESFVTQSCSGDAGGVEAGAAAAGGADGG